MSRRTGRPLGFSRRHFLQALGATGLLAATPRLLIGCGGSDSEVPAAVPWPEVISTEPPTLGGDASLGWWNRGNYAPVTGDLYETELSVVGAIPPGLNGTLVRNGANPVSGESSHWFMGDGMVHGIRLEAGTAVWYRNHQIETEGVEQPENPAANRANTAVYVHDGRLLALFEAGLPTELSTTDLSTIGLWDFGGALAGPMTAHPKTDPSTKAMHFIGSPGSARPI